MFDSWFEKPKAAVTAVERSAAAQATVDGETADLALYYYDTCMFCRRVLQAIEALKLNIEMRNVMQDREHYRELLTHGGRTTVPCLRIGKNCAPENAQWMFESADIVAYLGERFGATPA